MGEQLDHFYRPYTQQVSVAPPHAQNRYRQRNYAAGIISQLHNGWNGTSNTTDQNLRLTLARMRKRSRLMEMDTPFYRRYLQILETEIVGHQGVLLQMMVNDEEGRVANVCKLIEDAFGEWGLAENCSADGRRSWVEIQAHVTRITARDGEIFTQLVYDSDYRDGLTLKFYGGEHLDENYNVDLSDGARIRSGIEVNRYGKPVAYWLWRFPPDDHPDGRGNERMRIPASEIIHSAEFTSTNQSRGYPWGIAAMADLDHLAQYEEAAMVAAQQAALTAVFLERPLSEPGFTGIQGEDEPEIQLEAGMIAQLPAGWKASPHNPAYPNVAYDEYTKNVLRKVAAALDVPYHQLTGDLSEANFSTARVATKHEQANWRKKQNWLKTTFCRRVFEAWLKSALLHGSLPLSPKKFAFYNKPFWRARTWPYVDPYKDAMAAQLELACGMRSLSDVIIERGGDPDEVFEGIAADEARARALGIDYILPKNYQDQILKQAEADGSEESAINKDNEKRPAESDGAKGKDDNRS